jgi:hypothetical protein
VARGPYRWKPGYRSRVRADVAGKAIEDVRRRNGGVVTPAVLVEAARAPRHPLHRAFEWDDDAAAEKYREWQARSMLNSIRVVIEDNGQEQRQVVFVSVKTREVGRAYIPTSVVVSDVDYRAQALAEAFAALEGWRRRYRHLTELAEVFEAADRARARVAKKKVARKAA